MTLAAGTRLGAYDIVALIGAGGMGEVYRARDTRLKREVAIKVLPAAFASDAERLARFQREAELLATLNHPNIGAVYGFEQSATANAIVLELIEGDTLADRIQRGAIPVKQALQIALQIAEALEAAHERGIIHRDLKPANIKITADDKVKVLDFGLAKAMEPGPAKAGHYVQNGSVRLQADLSHSPTLSMMATQAGMILGTAAYMSPEQAKGFPADQRSDIFAFGVVLYQMLTGRQPFHGETAPDVLASVIVRDVDFAALPANLNPRVREFLERCLEKNPKRRWQAIGDVRAEMEAILRSGATQTLSHGMTLSRGALIAAMGAVSLLTAVAVWNLKPLPQPQRAPVARFDFPLSPGQHFTNSGRHLIAVSPDGTQLAYVANAQIHLRTLATGETKPLADAASPGGVLTPAFSPDGQSLAFWSGGDGTLKKIAVHGRDVPVSLARVDRPFGVSWASDYLYVGQATKGIVRVPATAGAPETIVSVEATQVAHGPQLLPDGDNLLFTLATDTGADRWDKAATVVQSLKTGRRTVLVQNATDARYVPTGHILYARGGVVFAAPFDAAALTMTGAAVPVIEGVRRAPAASVNSGAVQFAISEGGTLMYIPGDVSGSQPFLALMDREGKVTPLKLRPAAYTSPRLSPDGTTIAFELDTGEGPNVWIYELAGTTAMRRLTFGGRNRYPIWSADGSRITFQSDREGDAALFWQRVDNTGSVERLTKPDPNTAHIPDMWSPKGDVLLYSTTDRSTSSLSMLSYPDRKVSAVGDIRGSIRPNAVFSPDGRWIAYQSTEGHRRVIFVEPFPVTGNKTQVVTGENIGHPMWARHGHELLYTTGPTQINSVSITITTPTPRFGNPVRLNTQLVNDRAGARSYDVSKDGKTILGIAESDGADAAYAGQIRVVLNWFEELKQRVPTTRRD